MEETKREKIPFYKKRDVQITGIVVILLLLSLLFTGPSLFGSKETASPNYVVVTYGDGETMEIPLGKERIVRIEQDNGAVNEICVFEEGVYMHSSTCFNQDCVEQGVVDLTNYESRILSNYIICLPNQVAVELMVKEVP